MKKMARFYIPVRTTVAIRLLHGSGSARAGYRAKIGAGESKVINGENRR